MTKKTETTPPAAADSKTPYERRLLKLTFLAPDIQKAALDGRRSTGLTLERLIHGGIAACWAEQRQMFMR